MKTPAGQLAHDVQEIGTSGVFAGRSENLPTWCPGCGYFGIHHALTKAVHRLGLPRHDVVIVSGIGCAGRYPFFADAYGLHTVHGRALPVAQGVKLANPRLTVLAVGGDGDGLAIGGGHLPHAARRNVDINYFLFDNSVYGLTKGQPSPTSPLGFETKASPGGTLDAPLNGTLTALAHRASFVARLFAGDPEGMEAVFTRGMKHGGFSFFHIYSSCVTFDKQFKTWQHLKERMHPLPPDHDPSDYRAAFARALDDDFTVGVFYQSR